MMERERLEELMSLYALGILQGDELKEAERLINSGSPEALALLGEYDKVVSMMSYSTPGVEPDPALKKKLLSDFKNTLKSQSDHEIKEAPVPLWERIRPLWLGLGGAALAAAVLVLFISNLSLRDNLNDRSTMISELKERISSQEEELGSLRETLVVEKEELAKLEDLARFLNDPDVVIVKLRDTSPAYDPVGRVHWDKPDNEALFVSLNLPPAPSGKIYQWWIVADGTPKSAGIFKVDSEGKSLIKIGSLSDFGNIQNFLLTLEPEGGAESPTGDRFLMGDSI
jgi:anti-sigma-K factor RskA